MVYDDISTDNEMHVDGYPIELRCIKKKTRAARAKNPEEVVNTSLRTKPTRAMHAVSKKS